VAGLALSTGDRLLDALHPTPVGPRWRAEAPGGGLFEALLIEPLRDDLPPAEARRLLASAATLQHPQLRPVRRTALDPQRAVLVYDPAEGVSLARWLAREAPHGIDALARARELFDQVCQGVAAVHRAGLAHGGVAPWSVHVVSRGTQVITRVDGVGAALLAPLTDVDRVAPELDPRVFGATPRADVFALGLLLGTILLGEETPTARVSARLDEARPDLDDSVRALLRACLTPDPEGRPADAARVRELVRRAVWTPREAPSAPARPAVRAPTPAVFARAPAPPPPPTPAVTPPGPAMTPPLLDDPTLAVHAPPPSDLPEDPDPTAFVTALPAADEPSPAHSATLRTPPRRAARDDVTRAVAAPPPDAPTEHTRHVLAPPPDPTERPPEVFPPEVFPPESSPPESSPPEAPGDDLWDSPRSSFHVISVPPAAPVWTAPPAPPALVPGPPPLTPTAAPLAPTRVSPASVVVTALVAAVFLAAMLIALTR
jgi:serine/threonine protein kinase